MDGALRVRVAAAPVDDAANRAVARLIAGALGVAPSRVAIVAGATGHRKTIEVTQLAPGALETLWPDLVVSTRSRGRGCRR